MSLKEKNIKIKLSKKYFLYGKFSGSFDRPLVIILHGLSGDMDEDLYIQTADWFQKKNYSTFRFNFYSFQKDARQLMDSTLKIHVDDFDKVVEYFKKRGVKNIFVIGHSFAGLVILSSAQQNFEAAVLWDPTYKISFTKGTKYFPAGKYIKELKAYAMHWGVNIIISKSMAEEIDTFPWKTVTENFIKPLKLIIAGNGELKDSKKYLNSLDMEKDYLILKGATHYFNDSLPIRRKLFISTNAWFKKFL